MLVGIDEVGRGCWAGPLVAAAVALGEPLMGLKDSKVLTKKQRGILTAIIQSQALAVGIGWSSVEEIDALGLTASVKLAMHRALNQISVDFDELIIDGNINFFPDEPRATALVKADASVPAVSAASIVAKVARDTWMATEAASLHPQYHFEKHVGYGTALHAAMLTKHGVSPLHRRSFKPIRTLIGVAA